MSINETRVSRLLRDARMTAARPERPDTARELVRMGSGRLLAGVTSDASAKGETLVKACARLGSPSTVEGQMAALNIVDKELGVCQQGAAADALKRCSELMSSGDTRVQIRAASILVKWCGEGALLSEAVRALILHATEGRAAALRAEGAFDALVHRLKAAGPGNASLVRDGLGVLRYASSDGSAIMQHFVTIGVLPVLNLLAAQYAASGEEAVMVHAATLLRNISVDYGHHMLKVGSLPVLCSLFEKCIAHKEVISLASRATAKLVYDDACLAWFSENTEETRKLCKAASSFMGSRMIASRLIGTTLTRILEESPQTRHVVANDMPQFLQQVVEMLKTVDSRSGSSAEDSDVVQGMLRFVAAATLDEAAGRQLVALATDAVMEVVQDKELETSREVVLNSLFTLCNLSFYYPSLGEDDLERLTDSVGPLVAAIIFDGDVEGSVEATRLLGNLTATPVGARWAEKNRLDEACLLYVNHEDPRIVYNCFGVLLNLTSRPGARLFNDAELCRQLLDQTGLRHTTTEDSSPDDIEIADVVEKVLLNLTTHF
jgi:hypothetical protein